jgi:hypothetical protein
MVGPTTLEHGNRPFFAAGPVRANVSLYSNVHTFSVASMSHAVRSLSTLSSMRLHIPGELGISVYIMPLRLTELHMHMHGSASSEKKMAASGSCRLCRRSDGNPKVCSVRMCAP